MQTQCHSAKTGVNGMDYDYNRSQRRFSLLDTAQESPKPVLVEPKRRKRGPKINTESAPGEPQTPFDDPPAPPIAAFPDHARVPSPAKRLLEARELFEYWNSVPEPERSSWFIAYVYRKYPFCDVYQPFSKDELLAFQGSKGKKKVPFRGKLLDRPDSNCGTLPQPLDPDNWEQQIYERWGAGDYQIRLNDQHESIHGTVTECHIRNLRDWDKYPPVLALNTVVMADENNAPYIRWARLKGIKFPGDPTDDPQQTTEGEEDMAALEAVLQQNKELNKTVLEMAKDRNQPASQAAPTDAAARAQMGGVETVVEASKQGMKIMGDAMARVVDSQIKDSDPTERLKQSIEIAKLMAPAPAAGNGGMDTALKMMEMQMTQQREQARIQLDQQEKSFTRLIDMQRESNQVTVKMLEKRIDSLEAERAAKTAGNGEAPASSDEAVLDKYVRIRRKMKELDEEDGAGESDGGPAWLAPALQFGEKAITGISDSLKSLASIRAGQPAPPTIQEVVVPQQSQQTHPQQNPENELLRTAAMQVHKPLVDAIKAGRFGYDFGAAVVNEAGQGAYDFISKDGYNGIVKLLQSHPPLWQELLLPPIGAPALEKFLAEFLDAAKVKESLQMMTAAASQQQTRRGPKVNQ